jgi:hypothetical protein
MPSGLKTFTDAQLSDLRKGGWDLLLLRRSLWNVPQICVSASDLQFGPNQFSAFGARRWHHKNPFLFNYRNRKPNRENLLHIKRVFHLLFSRLFLRNMFRLDKYLACRKCAQEHLYVYMWGQKVAAVPSGLSPTPLIIIIIIMSTCEVYANFIQFYPRFRICQRILVKLHNIRFN